ncbi:hypothetical protein [Bradyrhizobium sp. 87]|uniref:hypothetical protein n=1 Tax=Bradyrhizobium sp. 87 TaxID=2782682 RepID=UPI001FFADA22|nr:hypothetical protein [Bradyrhizobium sp. 87]MCK1428660.1 hypothetical protein [Bradyrhizobium sp. 87]
MTDDSRAGQVMQRPKSFPSFAPQITKTGRWFVAVKTGVGPVSHIADFAMEADAMIGILARRTEKRNPKETSLAERPSRPEAIRGPGGDRAEGRKMSQVLDELKKQAQHAETKALALPQNPERDQLLCDLANFRATLAKPRHEREMDQG